MDREEIERRDFPIARRGYEQGSVDEHLRQVADGLERSPAPSLSAGTSEHVRAILEAAERSAAELHADADRRAGEHVQRVSEAADGMLRRLDELQGELGSMMDALRASGERLAAGLGDLNQQVGRIDEPPAPEPAAAEPPAPEPVEDFPPTGDDEAAARITALNMALSGSPREETAAYLAEHYELADADALLDDVYSKAGQ